MPIYDVNKLLNSNIPEGDYDTLSGYLQEELFSYSSSNSSYSSNISPTISSNMSSIVINPAVPPYSYLMNMMSLKKNMKR